MDNATSNILSVGTTAKITTTSADNTFDNTNSNTLQVGGTTRIRADTVNTSLIATAGGGNYLQVGADFKITTTATATTFDVNNTFTFCPTATVIHNFAASLSGFLLCDGSSYSTTTYNRLYLVIGTTFGSVGFGFFNVPSLKGAFLRGAGSQTIGGITYDGSTAGTKQADATLGVTVSASATATSTAISTATNTVTNPYATSQGYRNVGSSGNQCVNRSRITSDPVDTNTGIKQNTTVTTTVATTVNTTVNPTVSLGILRTALEVRPFNVSINYFIRY